MGIITRMRKQTAVYWPLLRIDSQNRAIVGDPVEIACRWDDSTEIVQSPMLGGTFMSNATVYVDREVTMQGYLWKGALADAPDDPTADALAFEIRWKQDIPNFRATDTLRIVKV